MNWPAMRRMRAMPRPLPLLAVVLIHAVLIFIFVPTLPRVPQPAECMCVWLELSPEDDWSLPPLPETAPPLSLRALPEPASEA